jgi:hypothetical protein
LIKVNLKAKNAVKLPTKHAARAYLLGGEDLLNDVHFALFWISFAFRSGLFLFASGKRFNHKSRNVPSGNSIRNGCLF